jgi:redox-sensitive bicupin YhaK (pirin superfamily)
MIRKRRSSDRGHAGHGWLDSWHTFSFADYHDPAHMGFSVLRVINQDRVKPGSGFGAHGHRDMEIVTWVIEGALEHRDDLGNGSVIRPGDAQLMSAGTGIVHSEFNPSEDEPLELLQMWVLPAKRGGAPRYEQRNFSLAERQGKLARIVAPDGEAGALRIRQDVALYAGRFAANESAELVLAPGRSAWLHVARGELLMNDVPFEAGDGAGIEGERSLVIQGKSEAELVLFDLPAE